MTAALLTIAIVPENNGDGRDRARELSIFDVPILKDMLESVAVRWGGALGIATGRPRLEAERAFGQLGPLHLFSPGRVVCYDDVIISGNRDGEKRGVD